MPSRNRDIVSSLNSKVSQVRNWLQIFLLKCTGIDIDNLCCINSQVAVKRGLAKNQRGKIRISANVVLDHGVVLDAWGGSIEIAESVFLGPYTVIYGHGGVTIGRDSLIAMHCRILSSNHAIPDRSRHIRWEPDIPLPTTIGEDVWLGAGVTVLGGVTIGNGCVVGAGAVVTHDLPPYSVAVGVPAKVIRMRTGSEQVALQEFKDTVQQP